VTLLPDPLERPRPRIAVLAPSTFVTVTIEDAGRFPEVHFHAGGQGLWVARMASALGAEVALATALGGESGNVLRSLLDREGVTLHSVRCGADNGVRVHDRRGGERRTLARAPAPRLHRHEADELYGISLADGLERGVACLTGPEHADVLDAGLYARLAADLRRNGVTTLADLTRPSLAAALTGGVDILRLSDVELVAEGLAADTSVEALAGALADLHESGAGVVIASRGDQPAIALVDGELFRFQGPVLTAADPAGTGDSMLAGIAVAVASGRDVLEAIVFGVAAGAVNAARHGLGSGTRRQVDELARCVGVEWLAGSLLGGPA
jgi:1-phosphofructokinase